MSKKLKNNGGKDIMEIAKQLQNDINYDYITFDEYQDKYYLTKKLKKILPDYSDKRIYGYLNSFSTEEKRRIKKSKFINKLINLIKFDDSTVNRGHESKC